MLLKYHCQLQMSITAVYYSTGLMLWHIYDVVHASSVQDFKFRLKQECNTLFPVCLCIVQ